MQRRQRPGRWLLILGLSITLLWIIIFFAWGTIAGAVTRVKFLSSQEVTRTELLEGILIKEERVVTAPVEGQLQTIVQDGTRLEVGAVAAQVLTAGEAPGGINIFTPSAGIFCTHLDGLENILSSGNLDILDLSRVEKTSGKITAGKHRVEKGQPVFKIIDNLSPLYIYAEIPKSHFPLDLADKPKWLPATWENMSLLIKPHKLADKGDRWEGIFLLADYPESLLHYRRVRLAVTTDRLEGHLVPAGAVVYRDGTPGIYLAVKKKARWVPVKIEGELAGMVAVSGRGLSEETRYVSNPVFTREGSRVE